MKTSRVEQIAKNKPKQTNEETKWPVKMAGDRCLYSYAFTTGKGLSF